MTSCSAAPRTNSHIPLHGQASFDCEDGGCPGQESIGQVKCSRRSKCAICCANSFAFGAAAMIGLFIVGPLIKHVTAMEQKHAQLMGKSLVAAVSPMTGHGRPSIVVPNSISPVASGSNDISEHVRMQADVKEPREMLEEQVMHVSRFKNLELVQNQAGAKELRGILRAQEIHGKQYKGLGVHEEIGATRKWVAFLLIAFGVVGALLYSTSDSLASSSIRPLARSRLGTITMSADDTLWPVPAAVAMDIPRSCSQFTQGDDHLSRRGALVGGLGGLAGLMGSPMAASAADSSSWTTSKFLAALDDGTVKGVTFAGKKIICVDTDGNRHTSIIVPEQTLDLIAAVKKKGIPFTVLEMPEDSATSNDDLTTTNMPPSPMDAGDMAKQFAVLTAGLLCAAVGMKFSFDGEQARTEEVLQEKVAKQVVAMSAATSSPLAGVPVSMLETDVAEAMMTFDGDGVLRVNSTLSPETAAALRAEVDATLDRELGRAGSGSLPSDSFGNVYCKGNRYDLKLPMSGVAAIALKEAVANIRPLLVAAVGEGAKLCEFAALVSDPGSARQPVHPDTNYRRDRFVVTSFVALQDVEASMGPTVFIPGSYTARAQVDFQEAGEVGGPALAKPHVVAILNTGDATMFDSRLLHCGEGNKSDKRRVLFYFSFEIDGADNPNAAICSIRDELRGTCTLADLAVAS